MLTAWEQNLISRVGVNSYKNKLLPHQGEEIYLPPGGWFVSLSDVIPLRASVVSLAGNLGIHRWQWLDGPWWEEAHAAGPSYIALISVPMAFRGLLNKTWVSKERGCYPHKRMSSVVDALWWEWTWDTEILYAVPTSTDTNASSPNFLNSHLLILLPRAPSHSAKPLPPASSLCISHPSGHLCLHAN